MGGERNSYLSFMEGFRAGASFGPLEPRVDGDAKAYRDGYQMGRDASREASEYASALYRFKPLQVTTAAAKEQL